MARSPKTVTFKVPVESPSPRKETIALPSSSKAPNPSPLTLKTHENTKDSSQVANASLSPPPDLVADIINRPQTVHPARKGDSTSDLDRPNTPTPPSKHPPTFELSSTESKSPGKPPQCTSNGRGLPSYVRLAHKRFDSRVTSRSVSTRDRSPLFSHKEASRISKSSTAAVARDVRNRTNSESHGYVRSLKQDVSQLREHLLKVEEEIKNLNRGRNTLELAVQDVRKALSVNQQSISTQQKKSSKGEEDSSIKLLREESRVLSKVKRSVEQHLLVVKSHLQLLDTTRRNLKSKISSLSSSLDLDAQNFKVYDGPVSVRPDSVSRQRQYASGYQSTKNGITGDEAAKLCSATTEVIAASKTVRSDIKALVISVQTSKTEAHKKITDSISKNVQEARTRKREILLERGQTRMAQNSALHQLHEEEIALGIAMGPVSEKHRSVSEKIERPLSQLRPASAAEERENFKQTRRDLTRRLSASSVRASQVNSLDKQLAVQLREGRQAVTLDTQTLRIRKMSLDNRWVN